LFKDKGYNAVSMRDIAAEVGVKAASLYNHIKSKDEILTHIIMTMAHQFTDGMNIIFKSDETTTIKLQRIIELHVSISLNYPYRMSSLNNDWIHLNTHKDTFLQLRNDYENHFKIIVDKGIKNNELKKVNSEVLVFSILNTLNTLYLWIPKKDQINQNTLVNDLSIILLTGSSN
jgi:AcrR family transcriptional regulator